MSLHRRLAEDMGIPPEPALTQEQTETFQQAIKASWQKAVTGIVEVGKLLLQIQRQVPHGQFGKLFKGPNAPFSSRTASALMSIAENTVLSNQQHAADLPASWYSLSLLTRLSDQRLEWLIASGRINASMQRTDVESLLRTEESRERRSMRLRCPDDDEPIYLNSIERDYFPSTLESYATASDTLRELKRVLVDIKDAREEIRCNTFFRREFIAMADAILSVVDGDPVPTPEEDGQSATEMRS